MFGNKAACMIVISTVALPTEEPFFASFGCRFGVVTLFHRRSALDRVSKQVASHCRPHDNQPITLSLLELPWQKHLHQQNWQGKVIISTYVSFLITRDSRPAALPRLFRAYANSKKSHCQVQIPPWLQHLPRSVRQRGKVQE